jgi:hypothetical protein
VLVLLFLAWGLLTGAAEPQGQNKSPPALRQTGVARGHTDEVPRESLCERAEDAAWRLVWRSCDEKHRIDNVSTSACGTVDYTPARDDGRGPVLEVRVQVEYDCLPSA